MSADFKSHVLSRDEKGFAGVPFKRLLLGGVCGGMGYTLLRLAVPEAAIPAGIALALGAVILTGARGGLPLWLRIWLGLRGALLLRAAEGSGVATELARLLNVTVDLAALEGEALFAPPAGWAEVDLREWVTFARSRDLDRGDGLVFVDAPLAEVEA